APARSAPGVVPPVADENLVAVLSSSVRKGRWRVSRRTHAYAVFGSVEIDLSEAIFEQRHVVIKAVSIFGSVDIRVPENVSLRGSGSGILGSFEVNTLDSPDQDAPVVYVDGLAVLGSIEARPKRGKLIRDLHDRLRKHLGS
uniref:LiaF domain-containing protein n=1 Tax=Streptomyces silaceus TaxID=545123 RepID=UPI000AB61DF5